MCTIMELFLTKAMRDDAIEDRTLDLEAFKSMKLRIKDYAENEQYALYVDSGIKRSHRRIKSAIKGKWVQAQ